MKRARHRTVADERLRFASGLPGRDLAAAPAPAEGIALLARIRSLAEREAEVLAPLVQRRFDGAEYHDPDPEATATRQTYDAVMALVDGINADKLLRLRIAALLARHAGRSS